MGEWYDCCVGVSAFQNQIPLTALLLRKRTQVASGLPLLISFWNSDTLSGVNCFLNVYENITKQIVLSRFRDWDLYGGEKECSVVKGRGDCPHRYKVAIVPLSCWCQVFIAA